eukprot:1671699-Pyramimonas_sp.AAC.1
MKSGEITRNQVNHTKSGRITRNQVESHAIRWNHTQSGGIGATHVKESARQRCTARKGVRVQLSFPVPARAPHGH